MKIISNFNLIKKKLIPLQNFPQFLYKNVCCRANDSVLNCEIIDLVNLFPVGVRILSTCFRADVVDGAGVVIIQKETR